MHSTPERQHVDARGARQAGGRAVGLTGNQPRQRADIRLAGGQVVTTKGLGGDKLVLAKGLRLHVVAATLELELERELRELRVGDEWYLLLPEMLLVLHLHQHLLLTGTAEHSLSILWKRFCLKMLFGTIRTRLSRMCTSSTASSEVTSLISDLAVSTADHLYLPAVTASSIFWSIVSFSMFMCSNEK